MDDPEGDSDYRFALLSEAGVARMTIRRCDSDTEAKAWGRVLLQQNPDAVSVEIRRGPFRRIAVLNQR